MQVFFDNKTFIGCRHSMVNNILASYSRGEIGVMGSIHGRRPAVSVPSFAVMSLSRYATDVVVKSPCINKETNNTLLFEVAKCLYQ